MRIVYLADFAQHWSTEGYVAGALESFGHEVVRVQASELDPVRAADQAVWHLTGDRPVLLCCKLSCRGAHFGRDGQNREAAVGLLRAVRVRRPDAVLACWVFDLMRAEYMQGRYEWARRVADACDVFVTTDSGLGFGRCVRQGYPGPLRCEVPHCAGGKKSNGYPCANCGGTGLRTGVVRPEYECDVAFLGEYHGARWRWYQKLRHEFGPRFKAFREGVHGDDLFDLCRSAKVVVGPPWPHFPGYWSNRLYLTTGYGGLFAGPAVPEMWDEGWIPGVNYYATSDRADVAVEELRMLLSGYSELRERIRDAGQRLCQERFTLRHRAAELVKLLVRTEGETDAR